MHGVLLGKAKPNTSFVFCSDGDEAPFILVSCGTEFHSLGSAEKVVSEHSPPLSM